MTGSTTSGAGATAPAPALPRSGRIAAIDIARGLAVLGMFAAHTLTRSLDEDTIVDGRSSILFATLAGLSIGLMTGGSRPLEAGRGAAYAGIGVRGLLLFFLGSLLWLPRTDIAVILDYYGIAFLLLLPALFAPRLVLAAIAAVAAFVGPLIDAAFDQVPVDGDLAAYAVDRLFDGYYPAFTWLAYLAVGLICARSGVPRRRTQLAMIGGGAVGMLAGYGAAAVLPGVTAEAHSDTTAEVLGSGGFAVALIGLLLLVTGPATRAAGSALRTLLSPIAAVGSMPLTIYTVQLLVLAWYIQVQPQPSSIDYPVPLFLAMASAAILFAVVWRRFLGAGPLERLMRTASGWPPSKRPPDRAASSEQRVL
ncbi:heparan-alpha-glucosaminide N-acetyltransferase domain-containing protein [Lysobacter korlensis]|uniref:Heparan-alpha-glucosaminide N-acetyltransferase domain-containing protein n=1 Tax=Lysobacter korlensis TaxID=553636 RepID=A0ABV6RZP4_9GAMM